ncbi:hypothetical protein ACWKWU_12895 [Chitinophaga lutea]
MKQFWIAFRNLFVSGLLLMLPLVLVVYLLGKIWTGLHGWVVKISPRVGIIKAEGFAHPFVLTGIVFLVLCVMAGLLMRLAATGKVKSWLEDNVLRFVPGYVLIRTFMEDQLQASRRGESSAMVWLQEGWQPCLLIEEGENGWWTVFIPQAPHFNNGRIFVVKKEKVKKTGQPMARWKDHFEQFGKGLTEYPE